jgi:hypothetical protein
MCTRKQELLINGQLEEERQMMRGIMIIAVLGLVAMPAFAGVPGGAATGYVAAGPLGGGGGGGPRDWPHPVKWDQLLPLDGYGAASWVDYDTPSDALTADDYPCSGLPADQYVTDIEFYGWSVYGSQYINTFRVSFWNDVPASPSDASHPGSLLYEYEASAADPADPLKIGWQEIETNHFKIDLPEDQWFDQGLGPKVLWISIQGVMVTDGFFDGFYWNFRERHELTWGDDAAFTSTYFSLPPWYNWGFPTGFADPDLYDGPLPLGWTSADMSFRLTGIPEPATLVLLGLGGLVLVRRR